MQLPARDVGAVVRSYREWRRVEVRLDGVLVGVTPRNDPRITLEVTDLGLELGGFAGGHAGWVFAALRLAPFSFGPFRPFTGAFVHEMSGYDPDDGDAATRFSGAGARLGLEYELDAGHVALRAELDAVMRLSRLWLFDRKALWGPYAGVSACHYF